MANQNAQAAAGAIVTTAAAWWATPRLGKQFPFLAEHKELISAVPIVLALLASKKWRGYALGALGAGTVLLIDNIAVQYFDTDVA